jgi:hypothetical protein
MAVMTEQSRQALAEVFKRAARSTLLRSPEDAWEIAPETTSETSAGRADPLLVITTTSFAFRLLTIFHVSDSEANRSYFLPVGAACTMLEGFAELANLCCGALNREMRFAYPHLAMSVPSQLNAGSLEHLAQLKAEYISRFAVSINGAVKLRVTLCMCCFAPIEILEIPAGTEPASGVLELL